MIGLGSDPDGGLQRSAAVFTPVPSTSYQISPVADSWLATGEYEKGQLINVTALGTAKLKLSFDTGATTQAVVHQPDGKLYLQG